MRYPVLIVLCAAAFLALIGLALHPLSQTFVFPDSRTYLAAAKELYLHGRAHEARPLGIAALDGLPLAFGFGDKAVILWSRALNAGCWIGTALLLFAQTRSFVNGRCAFLWTLAFILCAGPAILVFHLLSELPWMFFLMLSAYCLFRFSRSKRTVFLSGAIGSLAFAMLVKPGVSLLLAGVVVYYARSVWERKSEKSMTLFYLGMLAVLLNMTMMWRQFGNFTVSYIGGFTYYNYLGTRADCLRTGETYVECDNARYRYLKTLSNPAQEKVAFADMRQQLLHNAGNLIEAYSLDVFENATHGSAAIFRCGNPGNAPLSGTGRAFFIWLARLQVVLLSAIGILAAAYGAVKFRNDAWLLYTAVIVLYIIAISGISSGQGDRFNLVTYPFSILLIARIYSRIKPSAARPRTKTGSPA
jgi:hypothetical protein